MLNFLKVAQRLRKFENPRCNFFNFANLKKRIAQKFMLFKTELMAERCLELNDFFTFPSLVMTRINN